MSFTSLGLDATLLRALEEERYDVPTPIQQQAIPEALRGRSVVGSAQTGTGKTAAFLLPILHRLARGPRGATRALVLVPTRELAEQVLMRARAYGRYGSLTCAAIYGGVGMEPQTRALRRGVELVVATPGRLLDHIARGHFDGSRVEILVLDEADRMLDMGFTRDVHRILDHLPPGRQTLFFSATVSDAVDQLARRAVTEHAAVDVGRRAETAEGVEQLLVSVDRSDKRQVLARILRTLPAGRTLVFTRTRHGADRLVRHLRRDRGDVAALHGGKTQGARSRALDGFRQGETRVLVATDLAARGIDVTNITMVVNFDVPNDPEVYVHRVGRTARAGGKGVALTLMAPEERLLMCDVERLTGRVLARDTMPGFEPGSAPSKPAAAPPRRPPGSRLGGRRR